MTEPAPSTVYRDATFSRETRDVLAELLADPDLNGLIYDEEMAALRDVIARWDANDATETVIE